MSQQAISSYLTKNFPGSFYGISGDTYDSITWATHAVIPRPTPAQLLAGIVIELNKEKVKLEMEALTPKIIEALLMNDNAALIGFRSQRAAQLVIINN